MMRSNIVDTNIVGDRKRKSTMRNKDFGLGKYRGAEVQKN